jgi:4-amino-4-deoxy-L-arabinose transferase-like glycosyltransferase
MTSDTAEVQEQTKTTGSNRSRKLVYTVLPVLAVLAVATLLRFWQLDRIGFNSDEAVYTGTAASIAGNSSLSPYFPIFRAHPVLFQMLLSLFMQGHVSDWTARALAAGIGVLTVALTYFLGRRMYGHWAGVIGALILAVMQYHVIVSRQVLLDGLMTLFATGVLYCVVRYSETLALRWLLATGAVMGATILSKETSIALLGGLFIHFALTPAIRIRLGQLLLAIGVMVAVAVAFPLALTISGHSSSGQNYLLWQLFRRANHPYAFYLQVVPQAIGFVAIAAAVAGLFWLRRERTWRERLLICWAIVPCVFFTVWPVKGYQYLLPVAPVIAILAGRFIASLGGSQIVAGHRTRGMAIRIVATVIVVGSLLVPTWITINAQPSGQALAGTGGVAGGREAGVWLRDNVPPGAELLAIGPSMANILEFYGGHKVEALSVSPNPLSRNPSYTPVANPDRSVRSGEFQFLVWDSYTAARTGFFSDSLKKLISKYHAVPVFSTGGSAKSGPSVIIYRVGAA